MPGSDRRQTSENATREAIGVSGAGTGDTVSQHLAARLGALPGFPRTESGVEIRLLKKIAAPGGVRLGDRRAHWGW